MAEALWKRVAAGPVVKAELRQLGDEATRFRLTVFQQPRGPWRETLALAMQDAIDAQIASWDDEKHEHFIAYPGDIQRADVRGLDSGEPEVVVASALGDAGEDDEERANLAQ